MFDWIRDLLGLDGEKVALTGEQKKEVDQLLKELIEIGVKEDYLSERPGGAFNGQCQHRRAREIGSRLNLIGGMPLMWQAFNKVKRKAGKTPSDHLEYAWAEIGRWMA
jgi:hypothetical protein